MRRTATPETVTDAYTAVCTHVTQNPGDAMEDSHMIRALAAALKEIGGMMADDAEDLGGVPADAVAQTSAMLASASATMHQLVSDRDALMGAREWEDDTEEADGYAPPDSADSEALLAALADTSKSTGDFGRDELRAHVAWFHAIRNFTVHRHLDDSRDEEYQFDAFGVLPSLALAGLHQLIDAAQGGTPITADDLVWATQGLERLRSTDALDRGLHVPPCLRTTDTDTSWAEPGAAGAVIHLRESGDSVHLDSVTIYEVGGGLIRARSDHGREYSFVVEETYSGGFESVALTRKGSHRLLFPADSESAASAARSEL